MTGAAWASASHARKSCGRRWAKTRRAPEGKPTISSEESGGSDADAMPATQCPNIKHEALRLPTSAGMRRWFVMVCAIPPSGRTGGDDSRTRCERCVRRRGLKHRATAGKRNDLRVIFRTERRPPAEELMSPEWRSAVETGRAAPVRRRPSGMTECGGIEPAYLNLPFSQGSP